jgi:UDPglucose 6-dehydrogenase
MRGNNAACAASRKVAMKIGVFGAGYVGLVTAACLAEMGNSVVCCDVDVGRVARLRRAQMPIVEPQLQELVARNLAVGRLRFESDAAATTEHGALLFIAVGTPAGEDGSADLRHVLDVARSIGRAMRMRKVVINKSTVPVGTADRVREAMLAELKARGAVLPLAVVSNPSSSRKARRWTTSCGPTA